MSRPKRWPVRSTYLSKVHPLARAAPQWVGRDRREGDRLTGLPLGWLPHVLRPLGVGAPPPNDLLCQDPAQPRPLVYRVVLKFPGELQYVLPRGMNRLRRCILEQLCYVSLGCDITVDSCGATHPGEELRPTSQRLRPCPELCVSVRGLISMWDSRVVRDPIRPAVARLLLEVLPCYILGRTREARCSDRLWPSLWRREEGRSPTSGTEI
jgi:hypothetical protein